PHRVGAVPVGRARRVVGAGAGGVEPVVVVVERAVPVVAAVLRDQRGVVVLHAGVDVGHHDVLAGDAVLLPDVVGVDVVDAPLDRVVGARGGGARLDRIRTGVTPGRVQPLHLGLA